MHDAEKRKTAWVLFQQGVPKRQIARLLEVDKKTVSGFIKHRGELPPSSRSDKIKLDEELFRRLFGECQGYLQRVHEKLTEEHGIEIGYSTLTTRARALGLGDEADDSRCTDGELLVKPGEEMQQDTSPYVVEIGRRKRGVIGSGLYYRYCKARYLKFYLSYDRFAMKCFFHEGLSHFKFSARRCVIDNTNLAVHHGTGANAVFHPEMIAFARSHGFEWLAHEKGHANRKAGQERSFWTIETNFFPGRTFASLDDLNEQAKAWATDRYFRRPHSKTRVIPAEAFELEKPSLVPLPDDLPAPYREHHRDTDRYGYVALRANFYWVPGTKGHEQLQLIEYPDRLKIYRRGECLIQHPLAPADAWGKKVRPPGISAVPQRPQNERPGSGDEENSLRAVGPEAARYLDWLTANPGRVRYRHRFVRELYSLSGRITPALFLATLSQALHYGIAEIDSIERIASLLLREPPDAASDWGFEALASDGYRQRETYAEGAFSDEPDLAGYARLMNTEKKDDDQDPPVG